jgi:uncharacterized membrane protein
VAGIAGILSGARRLFAQARDEEERRGLRRYALLAIALTLAAAVGMVLSAHNPWGLALTFLAFFTGLSLLIFRLLPRITARRLAAEVAEDPAAEREHRRIRLLQIVAAIVALLIGGATVLWAILDMAH